MANEGDLIFCDESLNEMLSCREALKSVVAQPLIGQLHTSSQSSQSIEFESTISSSILIICDELSVDLSIIVFSCCISILQEALVTAIACPTKANNINNTARNLQDFRNTAQPNDENMIKIYSHI